MVRFHAILLQSLTHSKNQTYPLFYPNVDWMDEALRGASYGDNISFSAREAVNLSVTIRC